MLSDLLVELVQIEVLVLERVHELVHDRHPDLDRVTRPCRGRRAPRRWGRRNRRSPRHEVLARLGEVDQLAARPRARSSPANCSSSALSSSVGSSVGEQLRLNVLSREEAHRDGMIEVELACTRRTRRRAARARPTPSAFSASRRRRGAREDTERHDDVEHRDEAAAAEITACTQASWTKRRASLSPPPTPGSSQRLDGALLQLDGGAGPLELRLRLVGVLLGDLLEDRLRRAVDEVLGLLEAEARERPHLLDHVDLLVARGGEDDVELVLLLGRGGSLAATTGGRPAATATEPRR